MRIVQPSLGPAKSRQFGRRHDGLAAARMTSTLAGDIRLFCLTFAAGFLFMTVFLA